MKIEAIFLFFTKIYQFVYTQNYHDLKLNELMARREAEVLERREAAAAVVAPPVRPPSHTQLVREREARGEIAPLLHGEAAMKACGAQPTFIDQNILQAQALRSPIILRAGDPPQYNKHRSPKSGVNLSKTSKQGFFKGALAKEQRFARLDEHRMPKAHHDKDRAHLALPITHPEHQHTMHLDISMHDILREVGPGGDLRVLGFNKHNGTLRLAYKDGHGPNPADFHGQFIVNLYLEDRSPQFFSRPWDRPEASPDWDPATRVISKPAELAAIPDDVYEEVFHSKFKVSYTEEQTPSPDFRDIMRCEVFANRPRDAESFKGTVDMLAVRNSGSAWPKVRQIINDEMERLGKPITDMSLAEVFTALTRKAEILDQIAEMGVLPGTADDIFTGWTFDPDIFIRDVYDTAGSIVAGDWDGMALGHPPEIKKEYREVYNTFAMPPAEARRNIGLLMEKSNAYLAEIKAAALEKPEAARSPFECKALSITRMEDIVSEFAQARAGCITPHEFLFQQILNDAYRDEANAHYGIDYGCANLQTAMNTLLTQHYEEGYHRAGQLARVERVLAGVLRGGDPTAALPVPTDIFEKMVTHLDKHLTKAIHEGKREYVLPHVDHDMNVHNLFQHGFDMRNPYGSNLEGPWLFVSPDGGVLYGDRQEQLIEVMLTGDFLERNLIDISHGADMTVGWDRVVARQLELGQEVPELTKSKYFAHAVSQALAAGTPLPENLTLSDDYDLAHGWDRLIPELYARDYVIPFGLDDKLQAANAFLEVDLYGDIPRVIADVNNLVDASNLHRGWDKVIKELIKEGYGPEIEAATMQAYQQHIGADVAPAAEAGAVLRA